MDARTAEFRFKEADTLYREGRYDEALDCLIELDEAFPNTPNVLFPLARCMRRLGRNEEALAICDDLVTRCGDLRAVQLRDFIRTHRNAPMDPTPMPASAAALEGLPQHAHAGVLDDLLRPTDAPPPLPPIRETRRPNWIAIIGAAAALLVVTGLGIYLFSGSTAESPPPMPGLQQAQTAGGMTPVALFGVFAIVQAVAMSAALFFTLRIREKLPYEALTDNLINTLFMSVALVLLMNLLPCVGLIIAIVILRKYYELVFVDFLILYGFFFAASIFGALAYFGVAGLFG